MTPEITIRLATNDEGNEVARLAEYAGFKFDGWDIDWSEVYPWWLVAEVEGKLVACIQVAISKPIGRIEIMGVDPSMPRMRRVRVIAAILRQAVEFHRKHGAQAVSSLIPDTMPEYLYFLSHHDTHPIDHGSIVMKRIA